MRVRTHTNPFNFYETMTPIDFASIFSNYKNELDLEIGFGRGVFIRKWASYNPNRYILGVEVRKGIVEDVTAKIRQDKIINTHLIYGSGERVIEDIIQPDTLKNIFIFHPDPWFKKSHHKRRLVNKIFLDRLCPKLKQNARIYIATDVPELYDVMNEVFDSHSNFKQTEDKQFWETVYETHWHNFSKRDNRLFRYGVFEYNR